jgi:RNA polymerase sigma-70 factor (ECF subfamily)
MQAHAMSCPRLPAVDHIDSGGLAALRVAVATMLSTATPHRSHRSPDPLTERTPGARDRATRGLRGPRLVPPAEPTEDQAEILALIAAAQEGDGEAFGALFDNYLDTVHRYISYRVTDHGLAEDLTSETFLRALRRITTYSWQGRDFGAWLVTIARNLIADHFKSSRYKLELSTSDLVEAGADRSEAGPEETVLAGITNGVLLEAVTKLNPEQQECIVLRLLQGMSVAETALVLGKNDSAVKALQYRAVKTLGRLLPAELLG